MSLSQFDIFNVSEISWGDKKNASCRPTKKRPTEHKNEFFQIFFCCTSSSRDKTFLFYQNFISSTVQRFHGGGKKTLQANKQTKKQTNKQTNKQTTNKHRRQSEYHVRILKIIGLITSKKLTK